MILSRLGNKAKIAQKIIPYFPTHNLFISTFFGAGGMFFSKPIAKYNIVNDNDSEVYNLFQVIKTQKEELWEQLSMTPIHADLWNYYKKNIPEDKVEQAVRFIILSNFGYLGKPDSMRFNNKNAKKLILERLDLTCKMLVNVEFGNSDFEVFLKSIPIKKKDLNSVFIYNDPPYLGTTNNYSTGFKEEQSYRLFEANEAVGCKWAMSEFDHPFILAEAKRRNLSVHIIGERQTLKNRRTEILVTNYKHQLTLFDGIK